MLDVAGIIFETCKTYLLQQGKLLIVLFLFIAACVSFYYGYLLHTSFGGVMLILGWTVVGILGSYSVAWFGIRMNTLANSRMAFASLERSMNLGSAVAARMPRITITTTSSIKVKPLCFACIIVLLLKNHENNLMSCGTMRVITSSPAHRAAR